MSERYCLSVSEDHSSTSGHSFIHDNSCLTSPIVTKFEYVFGDTIRMAGIVFGLHPFYTHPYRELNAYSQDLEKKFYIIDVIYLIFSTEGLFWINIIHFS